MTLMQHSLMARCLMILCLWWSLPAVSAKVISPAAVTLFQSIDSLDVEHHWLAGAHVAWETGIPDGHAESAVGRHTHCSAFVAAAAKRAGIYILRPPEHPQTLLANAQYDWLGSRGSTHGWQKLKDGIDAQYHANLGWLVVATYRNGRDDKAGHIAIVRPSDKDAGALSVEGPQITQAGENNFTSIPLRVGFAAHPGAWNRQEIRFYAHPLEVHGVSP